jgi:hypothetical protein
LPPPTTDLNTDPFIDIPRHRIISLAPRHGDDHEVIILKPSLEDSVRLTTESDIPMQDRINNNDTPEHDHMREYEYDSDMPLDVLEEELVELAEFAAGLGECWRLPFYERMPDSPPDWHHLESGLRAMAEVDGEMAVWADVTLEYGPLHNPSMGGALDVAFDGYFGDPPLTELGVDPAILSPKTSGTQVHAVVGSSPRKGRKRVAFSPGNPHADVSRSRKRSRLM